MSYRVFTYAEYIALGVSAPWVGPFALENRAARDAGGDGKYYLSRGLRPLGGCVHITAGITDLDGDDSSAEATTNYGRTTTTDASWTAIVDSDSIINSLHPDRVGWVQGVSGYNFNRPIVGIEIGLRDPDWTILPSWWVEATLANLAAAYAPYVVTYDWPLQLLTDRDEIQAYIDRDEPFGFTEHWNLTPETRSDAGRVGSITTFPWRRFFELLAARVSELTGNPPPPYTLPGDTVARREPTHADMLGIERDLRRRGLSIYCGPSDWAAGRCAPGKHGHDSDSMHFHGRAIDFGYGTAPINDLEALLVELLVGYLPRWYPTLALRFLWNRGPRDHDDHGHADAKGNTWRTDVRPRAGVRARDGVDLFVPLSVIPEHVPPINGTLTLRQVADAQELLKKAGWYSGVVDGYRGLMTQTATRTAQQTLGLAVDGYPGRDTLAALRKHLTGPDYSSFTKADIEAAQKLLKEAGWYVGADTAIDGSPGPNFQRAMKTAQETLAKAGLYKGDQDLLPGPLFMTALRAWLAPKPDPTPPKPKPDPTPVPDPAPVDPPVLELPLDQLDALLASLRITRVKE